MICVHASVGPTDFDGIKTVQESTGSRLQQHPECRLHLLFCDIRPPLYMRPVWALQYLCLPCAQGDFDAWAGRECNMMCAVLLKEWRLCCCQGGVLALHVGSDDQCCSDGVSL
jgi:hypothetical protein